MRKNKINIVYNNIKKNKIKSSNVYNKYRNITGIVVVYETPMCFKNCYESIRKFYRDLNIIIVDGSEKNHKCYNYTSSIESEYTKVIHMEENIGHGRGMDLGINSCFTDYLFIFDSDIILLKPALDKMIDFFKYDSIIGVGYIRVVKKVKHPFIHPYFHIIRRKYYNKYGPYINGNRPTLEFSSRIYKDGNGDKLIDMKNISEYVKHIKCGHCIW